MNEIGLYGEFVTFVRNTLCLYEKGVDPSRLNGMWCKSVVKKGLCTFAELDEFLRYLADKIGDPGKFQYCQPPSVSMGDKDIVAIVRDDIFKENYRSYLS
ncbi:MAG: hypothetical protein GX267_08550 [Fibrobacter sp.]|jgi:hypothetical protein|nr:hypothetical protein [Fibrobacter sp.]